MSQNSCPSIEVDFPWSLITEMEDKHFFKNHMNYWFCLWIPRIMGVMEQAQVWNVFSELCIKWKSSWFSQQCCSEQSWLRSQGNRKEGLLGTGKCGDHIYMYIVLVQISSSTPNTSSHKGQLQISESRERPSPESQDAGELGFCREHG